MTYISITRLRLRSLRYLPSFLWMSLLTTIQVKQASGNLKTKIIQDANLVFWTITAWENETAMRSFIKSGSHRQAMPKLLEWCDEAALVHWQQEAIDLPDIFEAHRRMQTEGRTSRVNYPSPAQISNQITKPKIRVGLKL